MKGVQGSPDIVDAYAAQSEGFLEVVNLQSGRTGHHATQQTMMSGLSFVIIRDDQLTC